MFQNKIHQHENCDVLKMSVNIFAPNLRGSHKPRIFMEFCKPGKVGEFEIWSGKLFMICHIFRDLLIDELIFGCNMYIELAKQKLIQMS